MAELISTVRFLVSPPRDFFFRKNAEIRVDGEKEILISIFEIHPRNDRWSHI